MRVEVVKEFNDKRENEFRSVGDMFTCSKERFEEINSAGFGELVREVKTSSKRKAQ